MKKTSTLILILISYLFNAQTLPYLNASTANSNEFPVDADTSIYMFHGNRLVKTDKNFNTIWANTYNGLNFSNLLLSKTGSMYFIAKNGSFGIYFGKISSNGTILWVNNVQNVNAILSGTTSASYFFDCKSLFLDRNDQLLLSGNSSGSNSFILKTDTNGNSVKLKLFSWGPTAATQLEGLSIINDSLGVYKLVGGGTTGLSGSSGFCIYSFSDITNNFINSKVYSFNAYNNFSWNFLRSKFSRNFYVRTTGSTIPNGYMINEVAKFNMHGNFKWAVLPVNNFMTPAQIGFYLEEDSKGKIVYASSTSNSNGLFTSAFVNIDSSGVTNTSGPTMFKNYMIYNFSTSNYDIPTHAPRSIYSGNYYFDVSGYSFPGNPLTIQKFNSSQSFSCSSFITYNNNFSGSAFSQSSSTPTIQPVTSFTLNNFSTVAVPVTFSVNQNFCLIMDVKDNSSNINKISISPNPTQEKLKIKLNNNQRINEITVIDITGKLIRQFSNVSEIDVKDLFVGIYYIQVKTNAGIFSQKFVKE